MRAHWIWKNGFAKILLLNDDYQAYKLWNQRQQVKITLNSKIRDIEELALLNAKLASELVT
jgi:hypothetical protein